MNKKSSEDYKNQTYRCYLLDPIVRDCFKLKLEIEKSNNSRSQKLADFDRIKHSHDYHVSAHYPDFPELVENFNIEL
ncbi:hypothetical protein DCPSUM001_33720 [Dysgonomonas capnocytophagoides]|nr:hypothetical protein DCPSUM001_33720 [Dysgonomonas capnocytophagoides]